MNNTILSMIETLQSYRREKSNLMFDYVSQRLDKSFEVYAHELTQSIIFLTNKHEKSLLKRLTKLNDKLTK